MRNLTKHLLGGGAFVLPLIMAATAYAQAPAPQDPAAAPAAASTETPVSTPPSDGTEVGEVIVTATRTGPQRLQRTAAAVTVVGPQLLQQQGLNTIQDVTAYVPNLSFSRNTLAAIIRIRGIGSANTGAGSDASVTTQVDGVYIARASGTLTDFFDVERIEVLRGPQGTLYGRNAVGGTINVTSRVPSRDFTGRVRVGIGNYSALTADGYVSGPILGDTLRGSLAVTYRNHDPYFRNTVPGAQGGVADADRYGIRGQLRWEPTSNINATTRIDYSESDEDAESYDHLIAPTTFASPRANALITSFRDIAINSPQNVSTRIGGISEDVNWAINDDWSFRSITAGRRTRSAFLNDSDGTEINAQIARFEEDDRQVSQEFTVNYNGERFRAVGGLYYFGDTDRGLSRSIVPPSIITAAPASAQVQAFAHVTTDSYAIFGQGEFRITPELTAVFGGRYTSEDKEFRQQLRRNSLNPATLGVSTPGFPIYFTTSRNDEAFTPRIGLNYQATENIFLYASATRGFKSGGYNNAANSPLTAGFNPETLWSYEAGVRSQWLDRRLRLNATAFYYDYSDLQVRQLLGPGNAVISNAASATVRGLELEGFASILPDLQVSGNMSFLEAEYDRYPAAAVAQGFSRFIPNQNCVGTVCTINASGKTLDDSPAFSGLVAIDYTPTIADYSVSAHIDFAWRSRAYFDPSNVYIASQNAYSISNASISFGPSGAPWRLEAFVRNLTDETYFQTIAGNGVTPGGIAGDPRTFGVRASYEW